MVILFYKQDCLTSSFFCCKLAKDNESSKTNFNENKIMIKHQANFAYNFLMLEVH